MESVWACRWRLELRKTRSARFSLAYSAVVQPCYINVSVSGCLALFMYQRFPAHSVCLLFSHPLLVQYFKWNTHRLSHTWLKKKKKDDDDITKKEWLHPLWNRIWLDDLQYHSERDNSLSVSEVQSIDLLLWCPSFTYRFIDSWSSTEQMERPFTH